MENFEELDLTELVNIVGGKKRGGFGTWWNNFQRGTGEFLTGLRDGLAGR